MGADSGGWDFYYLISIARCEGARGRGIATTDSRSERHAASCHLTWGACAGDRGGCGAGGGACGSGDACAISSKLRVQVIEAVAALAEEHADVAMRAPKSANCACR